MEHPPSNVIILLGYLLAGLHDIVKCVGPSGGKRGESRDPISSVPTYQATSNAVKSHGNASKTSYSYFPQIIKRVNGTNEFLKTVAAHVTPSAIDGIPPFPAPPASSRSFAGRHPSASLSLLLLAGQQHSVTNPQNLSSWL